jgi:hypothetical protein
MSQQEPQLVFRSMYMSRYVTLRICHNMSHVYNADAENQVQFVRSQCKGFVAHGIAKDERAS